MVKLEETMREFRIANSTKKKPPKPDDYLTIETNGEVDKDIKKARSSNG